MTDHWDDKRQEYSMSDWSDKPTIFAQAIKSMLPSNGRLLDLGAGLGQDSNYFAEQGFEVVSTDVVLDTKLTLHPHVRREKVDLSGPLPFGDAEFDVVYSHLALHYFDAKTTEQLFHEIYRVLKPGGIVAFLTNSVHDPEFGTGKKLEDDYFETEGTTKRFFTAESARRFAKDFEEIICDQEGESYKDQAKGVHNLVRFVGKKPV